MKHLLVTNDFPPKIGGIQSLLWEWWRRLPPESFAVLTSPYRGADAFDAEQAYRIERVPEPVLLPHPLMVRRIDELAADFGADLVVLDPAVPLGLVGPSLARPYDVVLHGAEVTVPGRLPGTRQALGAVLRRARHVVSAGAYAGREAERAAGRDLPITVVPPGVDTDRFHPLDDDERRAARVRFGLPADGELVVGISRLVPRKGFDVAIRAVASLRPASARPRAGDRRRRSRRSSPRRAGRTSSTPRCTSSVACRHDDLPRLYGCGDVFTMPCRTRWGGLEQEGFGIVFVEAAACGVAQVAGQSGGAAEAVVDGVTGRVVDRPDEPGAVADAIADLLDDPARRAAMGAASTGTGRRRVLLRRPRRAPRQSAGGGGVKGITIVRADAAGTVAFVVTAGLAAALFTTAMQWLGAVTAFVLFAVGVFTFLWAYVIAIGRSRTDDISVTSLFLLTGRSTPAPRPRGDERPARRPGGHRHHHHVRPPRRAGRQPRVVARRRVPRADVRHRDERSVGVAARHLRTSPAPWRRLRRGRFGGKCRRRGCHRPE